MCVSFFAECSEYCEFCDKKGKDKCDDRSGGDGDFCLKGLEDVSKVIATTKRGSVRDSKTFVCEGMLQA